MKISLNKPLLIYLSLTLFMSAHLASMLFNTLKINLGTVTLIQQLQLNSLEPSLPLSLNQNIKQTRLTWSTYPVSWYLQSSLLVLSHRPDKALVILDVERSDRQELANYWRAIASLQLEHKQKAYTYLEQVKALIPLEILIERALIDKDLQEAQSILIALMLANSEDSKQTPQHGAYFLELGQLYLDTGQEESTELVYLAGIDYLPDYIWNYVALGDLYLQQDNIQSAYETYLSASHIHENADVARRIGLTAIKLGNITDAEFFLRQAVSLSTEEKDARLYLARLLRKTEQLDEASVLLHEALDIDPNYWPAILELALIHQSDSNTFQDGTRYYCQALFILGNRDNIPISILEQIPPAWHTTSCEKIDANYP